MATAYEYRVTGDHSRMTYSQHRTLDAALKAERALAQKWGWSHPGAAPRAERMTEHGWEAVSPGR